MTQPPIQLNVTIDVGPLMRLAGDFGSLQSTPEGAAMYRQWAARYLGFARRRYVENSRGAGGWPPLKASTQRRRRKGGRGRGGVDQVKVRSQRTGGKVAILIDTGMLLSQLDIGSPDSFRLISNGVRVGFLSNAPHQEGRRSITVAELAAIHDQGLGNVPARRIIVPPRPSVVQGMVADTRRAAAALAARHGTVPIGR